MPAGEIVVTVHPTARRAAPCDDPSDGLEAKFSIGYTTAHTLLHGPPGVESFAAPDAAARSFAAAQVRVRTDPALLETEARLEAGGQVVSTVRHARGSPQNPMDAESLARKVESSRPAWRARWTTSMHRPPAPRRPPGSVAADLRGRLGLAVQQRGPERALLLVEQRAPGALARPG